MKKISEVLFGLLLFGAGALLASDNRPIGVFDSGTGGLTVLEKMLTDDFAHEKFVYLGDQANMPYGDYAAAGKSDFLRGLVIRDAEFLLGKDAKVIVIACNTATAYGYDAVAQLLAKRGDGTRVIGVVNAGARSAIRQLDLVKHPQPCSIGVLATPGTIASGVYERTIKSELKKLGVTCEVQVFSRGCAGLADAVEAGSADAPKIACDNLKVLLSEHRAKTPHLPLKAVILGCTHFPFVQRELAAAAPKGVIFVDPAVDTAAECAAALKEQDRRTDAQTPIAVETYVSVAAPGLDPSKLDEKGGLTRAWKYGRADAAADRSTVPVPILEATKGDPLKFIPFAHMIPRVRRFLEQTSGRTALFNGRDLAGWTAVVDHDVTGGYSAREPTWFVTNGAIRTTGTPFGYLRTKRDDFGDFKLHVEYRWWRATEKPNSGVFVRIGKEHGTFLPTCAENQLCRGSAGFVLGLAGFRLAGAAPRDAFDSAKPLSGISVVPRKGADVEKPFGEWNTLDVELRGDMLVNTVNGVELNRISGITIPKGAIALQAEGGAVEFRSIWVEK